MRDCPGCSFLMGDDERLCNSCTSQQVTTFPLDDLPGASLPGPELADAAAGRAGAGTLLLDPPSAPTPVPERVRYRDPARTRRSVRNVVVLVALVVAAGVLGSMALRGEGPLATTAISFGLADPPVVVVPDGWVTVTSTDGGYDASLPPGAVEHTELVRPDDPAGGSLTGHRAALGEQGRVLVLSGDLGLGRDGLRNLDDAGFGRLVDHVVGAGTFGTETVRRDVMLGVGRAKDSVIVTDDERSASRVRFLLVEGRFHMLVTQGPDEGSSALDAAHSRLLTGFHPQG